MRKWATVTVVEADGRRHSVDVLAESTHDAAHLALNHARQNPDSGFPALTLATVFEIVTDGKVYRVKGDALQKWIVKRRDEFKGPKGFLFKQRAMLD